MEPDNTVQSRRRRLSVKALLVTPCDRREGFEYALSGRENLGVEYLLAALREGGNDAESINGNLPGELELGSVDVSRYDIGSSPRRGATIFRSAGFSALVDWSRC